MKISFETTEKVNGLLTLTVEEADYAENVSKKLKEYARKANVPGFRPGHVPMALIKRQYGTSIKADEINKLLGEELYKYIRENNIEMLGEPLPSDQQQPQDLEGEAPYVFAFDIAVAPEFTIELTDKDKIPYYEIEVDDKLIDQQVEMFTSRNGRYVQAEEYDPDQRDRLKGDLRELDEEGNTKEGGITVDGVSLLPQYIKVDAQKFLFDGAKPGDIITFNPKKAYPDNDSEVAALLKMKKEEVGDLTADFSYQVTEISRFVKAEVNQDLFDNVFGTGAVTSEEEFRARIAEGLKAQLAGDSEYRFLQDLRKYAEDKVGELTFPEALLKRVMISNNKDKGEEYVDKNFDASIRELKWHLIKEQLVTANGIKIDDNDVKSVAVEATRAQFAQYGMNNLPDDYVQQYADEMIKKRENVEGLVDRAVDRKLTAALKNVVKLDTKSITIDEFNKLMSE